MNLLLLTKGNIKGKRNQENEQCQHSNSRFKIQSGKLASDVKYISSNCKVDEDGIVTTSDKEKSYIVY